MKHQQLQPPFEERIKYYALIEVDISKPENKEQLMLCFEQAISQGWVVDGVVSNSDKQAKKLWQLREGISEAITTWTPYKNDISVTPSKMSDFLSAVELKVNRVYPGFEHIWFGHIGDGNLHLNILKPEDMDTETFSQKCHAFSGIIYQEVAAFNGSISAEHGIGLLKKQFLHHSRSAAEITIMKGIKQVFDPTI